MSSEKKWKTIDWTDCVACGSPIEVYTFVTKPGCVCEGDSVRCSDCDMKGTVCVDGDTDLAHINWIDE